MPHPHNLINPSRANHQDKQTATEQDSSELEIYHSNHPTGDYPPSLTAPSSAIQAYIPPTLVNMKMQSRIVGPMGYSCRIGFHRPESFSAHQMIYKKITDEAAFNVSSSALAALIEARLPGRVTLNEQKRENWLRELADSSVPLLKLSKNVPHGFKGEKLLEMLVSRKIDSSRATWYIRLIGLNEIFLQKQLAEVTVPLQTNLSSSTTSLITTSSRLAAMNVRSKPSRMLLKRLYFESLLDQPTFFKWLIDQLRLANLAQINFLLEIHHSVLDRFNLSSNLVRGFVEACLFQIRFAQAGCSDDISSLKHNSQTNQLREILKGDFYAVNWRVNELIGDVGVGTGIVGNIFRRRVQLVELYYKYFLNPSVAGHIPVSFKDKLEVLLSWATTPLRTSDKRVHLVANRKYRRGRLVGPTVLRTFSPEYLLLWRLCSTNGSQR
ncbi:RNA polymerase II mediator complex subunit [Puccinia graminis f. sp. tritici]|uniref:Mediator of RNA polymerase II transcription subunit 12 n=1 Tax=Puccinia graminis f. sp. tritici TaxID=56615 RepID=A0A5B0NEL7_PUCGR|nr:RNA polymerase II mediator complex subunit [Puccinia graminis f. sp. tritici]